MTFAPFCRLRTGLALALLALAGPASVFGVGMGLRERVVIAAGWRFQMDVDDFGEKERWYGTDFDRSAWAQATVPKAWDLYDEALWGYEGIAWYAVRLDGALARPGKLQKLHFGRVMYYAKVWLNGELLGENIGGYLPFDFDVTGKLKPAGKNVLVLRVDNRSRLQWLPAARNIEWMQYGGILEPVVLETCRNTFISDLTIIAEPQGSGASVECVAEVRNREAVAADLTLRVRVEGVKGAVKSTPLKLSGDSASLTKVSLTLPRADRWSPKAPHLYTLRATLESGGRPIDEVASRFGVRKVEARGRQLFLNGERLRLQGVNRYDEYGRYGPNPPRRLLIEELRRMKQAGINFVRVHYPQNPDLLSLYDEMGFMMMEEVTLNWWGNGFSGTGDEVQREDILKFALPFLERMIWRDKNHPCLVFWSMCNECATDNEVGIKVMRTLLRRAKELDRTRLVTFVLATRESAPHKAYEDADLVAVNVYVGGYPGKLVRHTGDFRESVGKAAEDYLRRQLASWPGKPFIVPEFGTPGVPGVHGDVPFTEEYQAALIEEVWQAIQRCDEVSGGIVWSWADYYHRRNYIKYAPFGPYGVVTVDRRPKAALASLVKMYGGALVAPAASRTTPRP